MCLQLKVWMSSFLNIKSSRPEVSCKKYVLKINILQNSLKNTLLKRDPGIHAFPRISQML